MLNIILLHTCKDELAYLDMAINCKKSCCIRIGLAVMYLALQCLVKKVIVFCGWKKCDILVSTLSVCGYLSVIYIMLKENFIVVLMLFSVELVHYSLKKAYFSWSKANVFRLWSGRKSDFKALNFVVERFFMKLFQTCNVEIIKLISTTDVQFCVA